VLDGAGRRFFQSGRCVDTSLLRYWYPLYAHARRGGTIITLPRIPLTQEFFTRLLEKHWLNSVALEQGRFRTVPASPRRSFLPTNGVRRTQRKRRRANNRFHLKIRKVGQARFIEYRRRAHLNGSLIKSWATAVLNQA